MIFVAVVGEPWGFLRVLDVVDSWMSDVIEKNARRKLAKKKSLRVEVLDLERFLFREHCASCSVWHNGGEKCNVEGDEIICIECGSLQDDRYQGVIEPKSRVVCGKKHEHA